MKDPSQIAALFGGEDSYHFARWGRPIVPVIFGVDDATLGVLKAGLSAVASLAGVTISDIDSELGANLMVFFCREWAELAEVSDLDGLVPDFAALMGRLKAGDAQQYRYFRFDEDGAIKAAFVFLRLDGDLAAQPVEDMALDQAVKVLLLWGKNAFTSRSSLARLPDGSGVLRPDFATLIAVSYDPILPPASQDSAHAFRLFGRMARAQARLDEGAPNG
ncbi:MAG: hypothetical protein JKX69_04230 [Rhodobacteraceae bacterium]|nr:hypothetical protein [Paracoccaceae bacterium]